MSKRSVTIPWRSKTAGGYAGAAVVLVFAFGSTAYYGFELIQSGDGWPAVVLALGVWAFGGIGLIAALAFACAAGVHCVNRTVVTFDGATASSRYGPFRWRKLSSPENVAAARFGVYRWNWTSHQGPTDKMYGIEMIVESGEPLRLTPPIANRKRIEAAVKLLNEQVRCEHAKR